MRDNGISPIYFQDEHCAVVYKRAGENSETFFASLFPNAGFAQAVHRLDQPVSGLVIVAFSKAVQTAFSRAFTHNAIQKEYRAVCERPGSGTMQTAGRLEQCIGFDRKKQKAFVCAEGKKAVLEWECCGAGERYDFIKIHPLTGRTHQIRVQLASIGRSIKGDLKYGARRSEKGGGIRLHGYSLGFAHPVSGKPVTVAAPPLEQDTLWQACNAACTGTEQP